MAKSSRTDDDGFVIPDTPDRTKSKSKSTGSRRGRPTRKRIRLSESASEAEPPPRPATEPPESGSESDESSLKKPQWTIAAVTGSSASISNATASASFISNASITGIATRPLSSNNPAPSRDFTTFAPLPSSRPENVLQNVHPPIEEDQPPPETEYRPLRAAVHPKVARDFTTQVPLPTSAPTDGIVTVGIKTKTHPRSRDLEGQLRAELTDLQKIKDFLSAFDYVHLKLMAPGTMRHLERAESWWLLFMTHILGSEKAAKATLARGAPPPPLEQFKAFLWFVACRGESAMGGGRKGWTSTTLKVFLQRVHSMRAYLHCKAPPAHYCSELLSAVDQWGREQILSTDKREKRIIRDKDQLDLLTVFLTRDTGVSSWFMTLQCMAFSQILADHGLRPGTLCPSPGYEKTDHYIKWEDLTWVVSGHTPGLGLEISIFWKFNWAKNMHDHASRFIATNSKNLPKDHIYQDKQLMLEVLAHVQGIFEEGYDPLSLREADPSTLKFPLQLKMKSDRKTRPLFVNKQGDGPLSYSSLQTIFRRVQKILGWPGFTFRCYRYHWCTTMVKKLSKDDFRNLLGHIPKSLHGHSTYQTDYRVADVIAARYDTASDEELHQLFSSVGWTGEVDDTPPASVLRKEDVESDRELQGLLQEYTSREALVLKKYGVVSHLVTEASLDNEIVAKAKEAWADVLGRIVTKMTEGRDGRHTRSLSVDSRMSVDSVKTDVSMNSKGRSEVDDSDEAVASESLEQGDPDAPVAIATSSSHKPLPEALGIDKELLEKVNTIQAEKMNEILNSDINHPFAPLVKNESKNVRLMVCKLYLAQIQKDEIARKHQCVKCLSNKDLPQDVREKDHGDHYAQHILSCQADEKDIFYCVICQTCLPAPSSKDDKNFEAYNDQINSHMDECLNTLLASFGPRKDDSKGKGKAKATPESSVKRHKSDDFGVGQLSVSSKIAGARTATTRYICPICISDKSEYEDAKTAWQNKLFWTISVVPLLQHMIGAHWNGSIRGAGIDYGKEFVCGLPGCDEQDET
ncbi:hypothetical protein GYMLUDRAFT_683208 [Collybiopsis luxurians FD-317 M1]|uniref:Uncharacterized protein n=1 Tax=Collybiopsis luxurians FD-317 M1 TaxID=944289 RepID=A0A0D0CKX1_9AGAR|nr:hypothetical protein GYMLUDRAFT_683208 [Collybiopsis luxurians FD-317 M1]